MKNAKLQKNDKREHTSSQTPKKTVVNVSNIEKRKLYYFCCFFDPISAFSSTSSKHSSKY